MLVLHRSVCMVTANRARLTRLLRRQFFPSVVVVLCRDPWSGGTVAEPSPQSRLLMGAFLFAVDNAMPSVPRGMATSTQTPLSFLVTAAGLRLSRQTFVVFKGICIPVIMLPWRKVTGLPSRGRCWRTSQNLWSENHSSFGPLWVLCLLQGDGMSHLSCLDS